LNTARVVWFAALTLASFHAWAGKIETHVATPAEMPVEDAAVVLEPVVGTVIQKHTTAKIEQRDREFIPYVTVVQTGTAIEFPNRDPFKHHVYSFSQAKIFEIKLYAGKPARPVVFDKPGEVALGCNIHDWMEAYILVVNSSYFAKTNSKGVAHIIDVPSGRYRLRYWHPLQKSILSPHEIEIGDAPIRLEQRMDISPRITKSKPPVDAGTY
jgi:plastocyanin